MHTSAKTLFCLVIGVSTCCFAPDTTATHTPCSDAWVQQIETTLGTGDGQGHGPDIGSPEWQHTVEFRLGFRDVPGVPVTGSEDWCRFIESALALSRDGQLTTSGPSFACTDVDDGSIAATVCQSATMSALDRLLHVVYQQALAIAHNQVPMTLKAEQRGWIKGRDDCWKAADQAACISTRYRHRIAELQARYRLVTPVEQSRYVCSGNPANELFVSAFHTDPATLIAERGDQVSFMVISGDVDEHHYAGRNEVLSLTHIGLTLRWGYGAPEERCSKP